MTNKLKISDSHLSGIGFNRQEVDDHGIECLLHIKEQWNLFQNEGLSEIEVLKLHGRKTRASSTLLDFHGDPKSGITLFSGHFVGFYTKDNFSLTIEPRMGYSAFFHLLDYTERLYSNTSKISYATAKGTSELLMAFVWHSLLRKALIGGFVKAYYTRSENLTQVKGRIDIRQNLRVNRFLKHKIWCTYRELSYNCMINQVIRLMIFYFKTKIFRDNYPLLLGYLDEVDYKLASLGVELKWFNENDFDSIRYTPISESFRPLMNFSRLILKGYGGMVDSEKKGKKGFGFFVDVAELWESYIFRILRSRMKDLSIMSPNYQGRSEFLLAKEHREIKPDILIRKNDTLIGVMDAKYKFAYKCIGKTEKGGISREDLYQMTSYLWHYWDTKSRFFGFLVCPLLDDRNGGEKDSCKENRDLHSYIKSDGNEISVSIGLIHLKLPGTKVNNSREGNDEMKKMFIDFQNSFIEDIEDVVSNLGIE